MENKRMPAKISSLDIVRAVAFIAVFSSHTMWTKCQATWGGWGVSVFLILSGFLMTYNYLFTGRINSCNVRDNVGFAYKKIKNIWILHIITTLISISYTYISDGLMNKFGVMLMTNIFMVQEWLPFRQSGMLNGGVSWYLCSVVLSYFVFPWVIWYMQKNYSRRKALLSIIGLFLTQIVIGVLGAKLPVMYRGDSSWWEDNWCHWLLYRFPLVRMIEFFVGCNMAYCFSTQKKIVGSKLKWSTLEIASIALVFSSIYIAFKFRNIEGATAYNMWWTNTVIYTIPSAIMVYVFAYEAGCISKLLKNNNIIHHIASGSQYAFLIHLVIINCINKFIDARVNVCEHREMKLMVFGSMLTWALTFVWMNISSGAKNKKIT